MWLLLIFIAVPIIEIALFIQVGGAIGLWPTLAIVVATALAGSWLMRRQGLAALAEVQRALAGGGDPARPLIHGAMILVAGVLLLTPGFFTDTLGILLLVPGFRDVVMAHAFRWVLARGVVFTTSGPGASRPPDRSTGRADVIDADFEVVDDGKPRT